MENLTEKLDLIIKQVESDKTNFEQLSKFEETVNNLQKLVPLEKPTYDYPLVDTVGRRTYFSLNKK